MFRTDAAREIYPFPFPMQKERFWDSVELTSRSPVLLLECDDANAEGQSRTFLMPPESMEALLGIPGIHIRQAALMAPDHTAPGECWRLAAISEAWSCIARFGQHSAKGWIFVLDGGAEVDTFGLGVGPIERVVQVYRNARPSELVGDHCEGASCGV